VQECSLYLCSREVSAATVVVYSEEDVTSADAGFRSAHGDVATLAITTAPMVARAMLT
jgi:hypothetical protein